MTRRRALAAAGLVVVAGVVVAVVLLTRGGAAPDQAASTSAATTLIRRQDLVELDTETGTLGYADSRTVVDRLAGTVTWLPSPGAVVGANHTLYKVDGKPVVLFDGAVPMYRALGPRTSDGPDVRELERNLRAFGYGAMTVDEHWDTATTAAVERWQRAHGLTASGTIDLGRIVFQPGARRVAALSVTLGASLGGGGGTRGASLSSSDAGRTAFVALTQTTTTPATTTPTTTTPAEPKPERPRPAPRKRTPTKRAPAAKPAARKRASTPRKTAKSSSAARSQAPASVSTPVMTTTSTRRVVAVDLDTAKSTIARVGARVSVTLPSGSVVHGRIGSVGRVATAPSSSDSGGGGGGGGGGNGGGNGTATIRVTIRLFSTSGSLDQAPVTVRLEQSRVRDALAVPVTALIAQRGGGFAVEVVNGASRRLVAVTPGIYTSGLVQIAGAGLAPGMRVTTSSL